ncbi:MAG TPA: AraC family transcriptional regulator [Steroidobacteraceae bacterium]|nr:AraC family transcriptional regulator [Steroidobacteraceae bacterium]
MVGPVWHKVRKQLGHDPIVAGRIHGSSPLFAERYMFKDIERTVTAVEPATTLVVQFGGGRVREGKPQHWRSMNLPTQSLLIPRSTDTHWHYSGTVDFAVFYFLEPSSKVMQSLAVLAEFRGEPVPFSDALIGAGALQLVSELQKGPGADAGFMERLATVMLEQAYRALVTGGGRGINPRHVHFARLQSVLNHIHNNPAADLSAARLAARAEVSLAHFCRIFRDAMGVPPHRYVLSARLDLARKLLGQSTLPISRIAEECGFSSQSHLTASFRAAHATTPLKYREQLQKSAR